MNTNAFTAVALDSSSTTRRFLRRSEVSGDDGRCEITVPSKRDVPVVDVVRALVVGRSSSSETHDEMTRDQLRTWL